MLKRGHLLLGGMLFSFFMGAGNIIFPPYVGFLAGESSWMAALGFLSTAVGLPLFAFFAVVKNKSLSGLFRDLPSWVGALTIFACYIALGPGFAVPRTGVVSYEVFIKPLWGDMEYSLLGYTFLYFACTLWLSATPHQLLDRIGKIIAPVLILLIALIACFALATPYAPMHLPQDAYENRPFLEGLLQGYLTMDALAALVFGALMLGNWTQRSEQINLLPAGIWAGLGLASVYLCLIYMGATAQGLAPQGSHGADVLTHYTHWLLGPAGRFCFGAILVLACLTSAVGLVVACAKYLQGIFPKVRYQQWVLVITVSAWFMSNVGLEAILAISLPVLTLLYPLAMVIIALGFYRDYALEAQSLIRWLFGVTFIFACLDICAQKGIATAYLQQLPLSAHGLMWLLPVVVTWCIHQGLYHGLRQLTVARSKITD